MVIETTSEIVPEIVPETTFEIVPETTSEIVPEVVESPFSISSVILTPEVVDDFRNNYNNPSEALAKDLVRTMQVDYADRIKEDPNFLTYEGLINGTAGIFDFLESTKGKTKAQRRYSNDQIAILFSNAEPATFARPFLSEFAKSVPATEAMMATARFAGPRIISSATAAGAPFGPAGAAIGFTTGVVGTGALSLFSAGLAYLGADAIEEKIMGGSDIVYTPGQRAAVESYRTLGGAAGGFRAPWLVDSATNIAGRLMFKNLATEAGKRKSLSLVEGLDKIISSSGKSAKLNPVLTSIGEAGSASGSAIGAYQAETMAPGETLPRLAGELIGGNLLYASVLKALPKMTTSADQLGDGYASSKQKKLFERINELYSNYGTPEQYDTLIENLTGPEMTANLAEAFPDVDFTAAQRGGDPLLMGVEAKKAAGEQTLDIARNKAGRESLEFMNNFIKGLISNGDPKSLRSAAQLRRSVFEDTITNELNTKMATFIAANKRLSTQPGQDGYKSQEQMSEGLYTLIENYIEAARKKEQEFWSKVPNIEVIAPLSPDAEFSTLPNFLQVFDEISFTDPAVQNNFKKVSPLLFEFIENSRSELGLRPIGQFSDAEIKSLTSAKNELNSVVEKLSGFEVNKNVEIDGRASTMQRIDASEEFKLISEEASNLPLSERSKFFRQNEALVRERILALNEFKPEPFLQKSEQRLAAALNKAGDYVGLEQAATNRSALRAGNASEDTVGLTSNRLSEVRSALLRQARSLAADSATSDEARRIGLMAEAISKDLDVEGFGEAYNVARAYTRAKHDVFTRAVLGQVDATMKSGAGKLPPEVTFQTFIKTNPSITLNRVRQLQGMAEFADQQNLFSFLPEDAIQPKQAVFTTTTNLIDGYLRGLKQVASKEVFDKNTNSYRTVINARALEDWKKENSELLKVFPDLQEDLKDANSAQRTFEFFEQRSKKSMELARSQTYLSTLIDGESPTLAVANAFGSSNPRKAFRNLFALRRMGAPNINSKVAFVKKDAGNLKSLRGLRQLRKEELKKEGITSEEINDSLRTAVLEHAYLEAGGEGAFNPQRFYEVMFRPFPKDPKNSLMSIADEFDIFPEKLKKRIKFMSEQMMRVQAADAAGKLDDPDFAAEAGPIVNFYVGVLGSAGGTRAFSAAGGEGAGAISAAGFGARELRKFMLELPAVAKLRAIDLIFTDPALTASILQRPGTDEGKGRRFQKVINILKEKLYDSSVSMAPFVVREGFEEEDRGTGSPLAEDPSKEIPALKRRLEQQNRKALEPTKSMPNPLPDGFGSLSPVQRPSPVGPPTTQASAVPSSPPPPVNSGPVDRTRYAALFPNDTISSMMQQTQQMARGGIASLMR